MAKKQNPTKRVRTRAGKYHSHHILRNILLGFLFVFCVVFLAGTAVFAYYVKDTPKLEISKLVEQPATKIYDSNGKLIQTLGDAQHDTIKTQDVPQQLKDAIVSIEDRRFYHHIGVDPIRIIGAFFSNLSGNSLQGGSTLTQQLIKLSYFSTKEQDQTLKRKVQEAWLAIQLERKCSKDQILDYYINRVYMDNQLYGMQTAAKDYYGKSLNDLSLAQTALLAGMPQAPTIYNPYTNPKEAEKRRNMVLDAMYDNKKISKAECDAAKQVPIDDGLKKFEPKKNKNNVAADNYITEVLAEAKKRTGKDPYTSGMKIYTNLDTDAQNYLYNLVNDNTLVNYPENNPDVKGDEMKTAVTVMDVHNGRVLAQIGDRDNGQDVQRGLNLAVSGRRDVGSTVKPFTDYAPAIEYLHYSTAKKVIDKPYYYADTKMKVNDYDNIYKGEMTMREALIDSRNVPAMKFFDAVGANRVKKFLKDGFDYSIYGGIDQSSAISQEMSSLQLASIYTAFANGGTYYKPYYINKIQFSDGEVENYDQQGQRAMSNATAYMITSMLKDVIKEGTGTTAQIPGLYQAGKSGTSNYAKKVQNKIIGDKTGVPDVSFVGYTTDYCVSVWSGYSNYFCSIAKPYQHISQEVYRYMMSYMYQNKMSTDWVKPDDVVQIGNQLYVKGYTKDQNIPVSEDSKRVRDNSRKPHGAKDKDDEATDVMLTNENADNSSSSSSSDSSSSSSYTAPSSQTSTSSSLQQQGQQQGSTSMTQQNNNGLANNAALQ